MYEYKQKQHKNLVGVRWLRKIDFVGRQHSAHSGHELPMLPSQHRQRAAFHGAADGGRKTAPPVADCCRNGRRSRRDGQSRRQVAHLSRPDAGAARTHLRPGERQPVFDGRRDRIGGPGGRPSAVGARGCPPIGRWRGDAELCIAVVAAASRGTARRPPPTTTTMTKATPFVRTRRRPARRRSASPPSARRSSCRRPHGRTGCRQPEDCIRKLSSCNRCTNRLDPET
jgi:hypothetical protein